MGHKTSLNKCKKNQYIQSIYFDHSQIKLEINNKKDIQIFSKHFPFEKERKRKFFSIDM